MKSLSADDVGAVGRSKPPPASCSLAHKSTITLGRCACWVYVRLNEAGYPVVPAAEAPDRRPRQNPIWILRAREHLQANLFSG